MSRKRWGIEMALGQLSPSAAGGGMVLGAQLGVDDGHANLAVAGQRADYLAHLPPWCLDKSRSVAQDLDPLPPPRGAIR